MTHPLHSALGSLILRAQRPIFRNKGDLELAVCAMAELSSYFERRKLGDVRSGLKKVGRTHPDVIISALNTTVISPSDAAHASRLRLLARAMPAPCSAEYSQSWKLVSDKLSAALRSNVWPAVDLQAISGSVLRCSECDRAALINQLAALVEKRVHESNEEELSALASIVASVVELRQEKLLDVVASRAATIADQISPSALGHIVSQFNSVQYTHTALAVALQEEAHRVAEQGDRFTIVQAIGFICRHEQKFISVESLQWLFERMVGEDHIDVETFIVICRSLSSLPTATRLSLQQELLDVAGFLSSEMEELLTVSENEGGLLDCQSVEVLHHAISVFLRYTERMSDVPTISRDVLANTVSNCSIACAARHEDIVSSSMPPYELIITFLNSSSDVARQNALQLLQEMAAQRVPVPALQTFRLLLALGDNGVRDEQVFRYLKDQFAKTANSIPAVQFCTALRCFVVLGDYSKSDDHHNVRVTQGAATGKIDTEEPEVFLRFCTEVSHGLFVAGGVPATCVLSLLESLELLGCTDADFFADAAAYLNTKIITLRAIDHSAATGTRLLASAAFCETVLSSYPKVHEFLEAVKADGAETKEELIPTQWMNINDPANSFMPLTEEQQHSWSIIVKMVATPSYDVEQLSALAEQYIELLATARPDDIKYFFGTFEDKILKEDHILKTALEHLTRSGIVRNLSGTSVAAILYSLSVLRFGYSKTVKDFLREISQEQWNDMEAVPLVQLLSALSKLSVQEPKVIPRICERLEICCRFLSPTDAVTAIRSLQSLRCSNELLLTHLMEHVSKYSKLLDDVALSALFSAPMFHRLLRTAEVAIPLLEQAALRISSQPQRQRIARSLKRASLPRQCIEQSVSRLLVEGRPRASVPLHPTLQIA